MAPLMRTSKSKDKKAANYFQLPIIIGDADKNISPCATTCTTASSADSSIAEEKSSNVKMDFNNNRSNDMESLLGNRTNDEEQDNTFTMNIEGPSAKRLFWETLLNRFLASLVLHSQSLYYTFMFHGLSLDALSCTIGAGMEGVFLISTICLLLRGIWRGHLSETPVKMQIRCSCEFFKNLSFWRIGIIIFLVATTIGVLLSDVGFQQKTGGERPDMWSLMAHVMNFTSGIKGEFKDGGKGAMKLITGCLTTIGLTVIVCVLQEIRVARYTAAGAGDITELQPRKKVRTVGFVGFAFMVFLYMTGSWMPIFHTYLSVCGSFVLSPAGSKFMDGALKIDPSMTSSPRRKAPNVVLVLHESLSGELMMTHDSSAKATPFFHKMLKSDDEYFVFEHARTVSGDTTDAITAIESGCNPMDKESRNLALNTTLATEFKKQGFNTVSFNSRVMNLASTKWFMTQHQLMTNFDQIIDPAVTHDPLENPPGQDDRKMVENFQTWLEGRQGDEPFFAQFYNFNSHYPFFNNDNKTSDSRLDGMLETVDQSIEQIFDILKETGNLDNTIVIGSADHGERSTPSKYGRLREWNRDILHVPIYVRMPRKLFKTAEQVNTLRYNTQQLVSTLDIYPTIMHLLNGKSLENYPVVDQHCVRGYDLLESKIESDRIAWSFPGVSKNFARDKKGNMAIHTGTSSSLYNRFGWAQDNSLSVMEYAPIIGSKHKISKEDSKALDMEEWKSVVQNLEGTSNGIVLDKKGRYIKELYKVLGLDPAW